MPRSRVMSFMSQFGTPPRSPTSSTPVTTSQAEPAPSMQQTSSAPVLDSPTPIRTRTDRTPSRPVSMVQTYQPPLMEVAQDTLPELQPIFTFLNSHSNKLYQEGYFLKYQDLETHGKAASPLERRWKEVFAQLVGPILSLWDAAALDAAGQDGEVVPSFINLSDASIKMLNKLPLENGSLENVLSVSTAGSNRYLFHFSSLHSLTQWTAGIRLAMFEHSTLQEAYTGALIAGKGKTLNNIRSIMDRTRWKTEDWARVRFGPGTPWRRCWCVIEPPDEKLYQKQQKSLKKRSAYDRPPPPLKGEIKFYDSKKTKKARPVAIVKDAFSAYAIYPQSKPLIDQSTLVKVEGTIIINSEPASTREGFVFVMPELHPAVSGFEMMLRWLFPVFDTFGLYGRPTRLIADTLDQRCLMFAMPKERRYGYLELLDVAGLIHTEGSGTWTEREWRKKMKETTAKRITTLQSSGGRLSGSVRRHGTRASLPSRTGLGSLRFDDGASTRSSYSGKNHYTAAVDELAYSGPQRVDSAPPAVNGSAPARHQRSVSEAQGYKRFLNETPSRLSYESAPRMSLDATPPPVPPHGTPITAGYGSANIVDERSELAYEAGEKSDSDSDGQLPAPAQPDLYGSPPTALPESISTPPAFSHGPSEKPANKPSQDPELRKAKHRMSSTTLSQIAGVNKMASSGAASAWRASPDGIKSAGPKQQRPLGDEEQKPVFTNADPSFPGTNANNYGVKGSMKWAEGQAIGAHSNAAHSAFPNIPPNRVQSTSSTATLGPSQQNLPGSPKASEWTNASENIAIQSNTFPMAASLVQNPQDLPVSSISENSSQDIHGTNVRAGNSDELRTSVQSYPTQAASEITRKPVPTRSQTVLSAHSDNADRASSLGSLQEHIFDQAALDRLLAGPRTPTPDQDTTHRPSDASSAYENDSNLSPDYASTRESVEASPEVERPRTGVLRTVGTAEVKPKELVVGDVHYRAEPSAPPVSVDLPNINFGPTHAYTPEIGHPSQADESAIYSNNVMSKSAEKLASDLDFAFGNETNTGEDAPNNHHGGNLDQMAPPTSHSRSASRVTISQEARPSQTRSSRATGDGRRSVAWKPAMARMSSTGDETRRSLTPEQYVQQLASAGSQQQPRAVPIYAHRRSPSSQSKTPPLARLPSGDWSSQQQQRSRTPSGDWTQQPFGSGVRDVPPRPKSQGPLLLLGSRGEGVGSSANYSAHLSAREQEHVARMTGTPLIQVDRRTKDNEAAESGLVGAIGVREREKRELRQGLSGQMVQQAIHRQQQYQNQVRASQSTPHLGSMMSMTPNYGQAQSPYGMPQQFFAGSQAQIQPTPPYHADPQLYQPQAGHWVSPQAQIYAQGGGWSNPGTPYLTPPQYSQQQTPQQYGQYFDINPHGRSAGAKRSP
ncbi:hypothetical protein L228DRAFT_264566 [Xylona heveae TC161]|uniref:PH domain-containing protein n=1 Tax=Xylona heveae (strain CBS 132557 / TC161) TaxID=1328760 RepID=A0A165JEN0_XYLHT|nr:hypothetical protein L228DRAFT_264566 [Xylona heveae TC161]KZF26139.1 hypothetical protein L228DRAFT_264566 [Xylona heveae TC161]